VSPFSVGPYLGIDYIGLISCIISLLKIGASCASGVERIWIIFSCIVIWLRNSGLWCLVFGIWYVWSAVGYALHSAGSFSWVAWEVGETWLILVWKMIPHCLIWCLWCERNARHFEDSERSIAELKLYSFKPYLNGLWALGLFQFTPFWS
jgi:hypothetical protein